jgi:uncharacterized protein (DUF1330 family)
VIEGDWPWTKAAILSFPSAERFRDGHGSTEYQQIARERRSGAEGVVLLVGRMAGSFERGGGSDLGPPAPGGA